MDLEQRIAQFEHMCREDPDNDMAHFSLGGAYSQAGRHADAAREYLRCIELNPDMSKAYQLAGACLLDTDDHERAGQTLTEGYRKAAEKGDQMPKQAIEQMRERLGLPIPEVEQKSQPAAETGAFVCRRTGKPGTQLPGPPFRGPVGEWIYENISTETWREWIGQGTKVINELKLDLSREEDQNTYDMHMREFLGIDAEAMQEIEQKRAAKT